MSAGRAQASRPLAANTFVKAAANASRSSGLRLVTSVDGADVHTAHFDIDPDIKHRLLNGLDDIALTLQQAASIDDYERDRERSGPVTTALV